MSGSASHWAAYGPQKEKTDKQCPAQSRDNIRRNKQPTLSPLLFPGGSRSLSVLNFI
jgi:hypothetical protein